MSASQPATMSGPWLRSPRLLLLLLLVSTTLTGTVWCQDDVTTEIPTYSGDSETPAEEQQVNNSSTLAATNGFTTSTKDGENKTDGNNSETEHVNNSRRLSDTATDLSTETVKPREEPPTTTTVNGGEGLDIIPILIPAVLVVIIIAMIVFSLIICWRWKKKTINEELRKEDPYLDGSSTEKVPMPMFVEEDVPSVLEVEMDELDQWIKKDGADESKDV